MTNLNPWDFDRDKWMADRAPDPLASGKERTGAIGSIYDLYGRKDAYQKGIGTFGTAGRNPYQQYLERTYDDQTTLFDNAARMNTMRAAAKFENPASNYLSGYGDPGPYAGGWAANTRPSDMYGRAARQFRTALDMTPTQRQEANLNYGGGSIPTLIRQGTRGKLAPSAADYIINRLPAEQQIFAGTTAGQAEGGGDFLGYLAAKYGIGDYLG
jgi:hypothetical protein